MTDTWPLTFLLCAISSDPVVGAAERSKDPRCGSKCLYVAMKLLDGQIVTFSQLESSLGEPSPSGYAMSQLADTARQFGFETLGVETTFENLCRRSGRFACIAHVDGGHFVVFHDVSNGKVSVIDPPRVYDIPLDTMRSRWKGTALLLANGPLIREESLGPSWHWPVIVLCTIGAVVGFWCLRRR